MNTNKSVVKTWEWGGRVKGVNGGRREEDIYNKFNNKDKTFFKERGKEEGEKKVCLSFIWSFLFTKYFH